MCADTVTISVSPGECAEYGRGDLSGRTFAPVSWRWQATTPVINSKMAIVRV